MTIYWGLYDHTFIIADNRKSLPCPQSCAYFVPAISQIHEGLNTGGSFTTAAYPDPEQPLS